MLYCTNKLHNYIYNHLYNCHVFQIQVKAKMSVNNTQIHIHVPEPLAVSETLITFPSIGNYNIHLFTSYYIFIGDYHRQIWNVYFSYSV